ncbi:hypothetical protein QRX60_41815 [Amycolatopsis mongoliensis]|uniref:Uncharacterized protein n=1 Tax=Amycolatopsis mongoliensis TaxID=715475 RepID=A0A9Y2JNB7_9PSEU|nr:hypothetical protein [Amycolatopsis sp. 4-36]WIY00532.1 hypothetical protein QRX60_41815 [Amycolatopsis sp. 4-36]
MSETRLADGPTAEERSRAIRVVKHHAHDSRDEADLLAMLGLDRVPRPPVRRPHGALSTAELQELLAPFAAERESAAV